MNAPTRIIENLASSQESAGPIPPPLGPDSAGRDRDSGASAPANAREGRIPADQIDPCQH